MFLPGQLWNKYRRYVESVTGQHVKSPVRDIVYWRDRMFSNFILYALPVSLISLLPAVPIGILEGHPYLILFDVLVAFFIGWVGLNKGISLQRRKLIVTGLFYMFALVTTANLGSYGPGVLYLMATTVFSTLILSAKHGYGSVLLHLISCLFFALVIHFQLFETPLIAQYGNLASWLTFSSNLIFLAVLCVVMISKIVNGLEATILKEVQLYNDLQQEATQTVQLHKKLKESAGHYKSLFVRNPSPMWVLEVEDFRFLQVNDAAVEFYGYSQEEFLRMGVRDLRLPEDSDVLNKSLRDLLRLGRRFHYVTQHRKKNGQVIDVEIRSSTIILDGKPAILAIGRDITEQNRYIKAIEEQNDKLQEIAYIQSHTVRAPLASIMGLVSLIKSDEGAQPDPEIVEALDKAAKEFDEIVRKIADPALIYDIKSLNRFT
jgi:PAS domain S-box-containing protein